jgi:hypothetical protein
MRTCALAVLIGATLTVTTRADDAAEKLAAQRKAVAAAWASVEAGPGASVETKNLIVWGARANEAKLAAVGTLLEKYHTSAVKNLALEEKDIPSGKIAVYLFPERENVTTFIRRVEKRRPESGELGTHSAADDLLHAAAAPSSGKVPVPVEVRAGEQLCALLLARRVGRGTSTPDWVYTGYGRANTYRVSPTSRVTLEDRKQAKALTRTRKASDLWAGTVDADEIDALQGSVVDFLAFGPGAKRFGKFLEGFKPGEGGAPKTVADALTASGLSTEQIDKAWKLWAVK